MPTEQVIDLSNYIFENLVFKRDFTVNNGNDLLIFNGNNLVRTESDFFTKRNPAKFVKAKDEDDGKVYEYSIENVVEIYVVRPDDSTSYTGTKYNETVVANSGNEVFDLKSGYDEIRFSGDIGNDEVIVSKNKNLNLVFDYGNDQRSVIKKTSGNDVILEYVSKNPEKSLGQVTIKNIVSKEPKGVRIEINGSNIDSCNFEPEVIGDDVTGTRFCEVYTSRETDEKIDLKGGADIIIYEVKQNDNNDLVGWGNDTVVNAKDEDLTLLIDEKYSFTVAAKNYNYNVKNQYEVEGKDLIITSTAEYDNESGVLPEGYETRYELGTIKIINGALGKKWSYIDINGDEVSQIPFLTYTSAEVSPKGTLTGSDLSDSIDISDYINEKGTGVKMNTKSGDDVIVGSKYNDTITSSSGDNEIWEYNGTNTIMTGNDDDAVLAFGTSSNTIKMGNGTNLVRLASVGINKVTCGNDTNWIYTYDGQNTIKTGNGGSSLTLYGGINNIITGKGRDYVYIETATDAIKTAYENISTYSNNVINTGTGIDEIHIDAMSYNIINAGDGGKNNYKEIQGNKISISNGINTVTSGKHSDKIIVTGGENIINSGAGNDTITVSAGNSVINGGKGDDIYNVNITTFNEKLMMTDTKGTNTLNLGKENTKRVNIFFDVEVGKKGRAVFNEMKFSTMGIDNIDEDGFDNFKGVEVTGTKVVSKLEYGDAEAVIPTYRSFNLKSSEINKLAADIASWLNKKDDYNSTDDVFVGGNNADITKLVGAYTNFAKNGYVFDSKNSLLNT